MGVIGDFAKKRINAFVGGPTDVGKAAVTFAGETLGTKESQGSPGILGVIRDTALAVKDTLVDENKGVLRAKGTTISFTDDQGFLNPFHHARKVVAGGTEIAKTAAGGVVGVISSRVGNLVKGVIHGGSRFIYGSTIGDFSEYLSDQSSGTTAGDKVVGGAQRAAGKAKQMAQQAEQGVKNAAAEIKDASGD